MAALVSALFALAFGVGGFMGGVQPLAKMLGAAWKVRDWQPVEATVLEARLERGDEGTAAVRARYRYEVAGRVYEATRVGLGSTGTDNVGSWQRDWHRKLESALKSEARVTAWIDPKRPHNAVLDRELRWAMVLFLIPFAVLFPAIGLGAAWVFVRTLVGPWESPAPGAVATPAAGELKDTSGQQARFLWMFAAFWCLLSFPIAGLVWMDPPGALATTLVSLFPLVGCGLLWAAWRQQARARRWHGTGVELSPSRPAAGQPLGVRIDLPAQRVRGRQGLDFEVRLAQYSVNDQSSGHSQTLVHALSQTARATLLPDGGARLTAQFEVPAEAPPTGAVRSRERVLWQLELVEPDSGDTQSFEFTMAGSRAPGAAPGPAWPASGLAQPPAPVAPCHGAPAAVPADAMRVLQDGDQWVAAFSRRGARVAAAASLLIAAGAFWWAREAFRAAGWLDGFWALARCGLGLACVALALHWATKRWQLVVDDSGFAVDRSSALRQSVARYTLAQASPIERRHSYQAGNVDHYALYLKLGDRRERLTPALARPGTADAVAHQFWRAIADRQGRFAAPGLQGRQAAGTFGLAQRGAAWFTGAVIAVAGLAAVSLPPSFRFGEPLRASQLLADWRIRLARLTPAGRLRDDLILAQHTGNHARLERALQQGGDPNTRADSGSTLLMLAARRGQMDHVETLLRYGADVNLRDEVSHDNRGDTALLVALYGGHEAVFQRLMRAGADLRAKNMWDWGPVHMAAQGNCVPCLDQLRRRGLPLHAPAPASRGETPAMLAAARGRLEALQWLVEHGADLRQKDAHGHDALGWALFRGQPHAAGWIRERLGQ